MVAIGDGIAFTVTLTGKRQPPTQSRFQSKRHSGDA
jgi:hypothetical protein